MLNPDSYDRLHALYKRFSNHPEADFLAGGAAVLKRDAYVSFLDLRPLILEALNAIHAELRGWRPVATFFETEPEAPMVLLWDGEAIALGYWSDDDQAWYRECEGPDLESEPLRPTKWMATGELMRAADDREFVAIERMT
jgi:hypothetical protein